MMDRQEIALYIRTSGIGVDPITLKQTLSFLQNHVGNLSVQLQHYQILSATAIVGETIVLNDVTYTKRARSGITLEHVMRHIGKLSKELYLQVIARQVDKWREAPFWLKNKIKNLQINYRIHKKYRSVFDKLSLKQTYDQKYKFNAMGIFWITYLFIKNQNSEFDNAVETSTLLRSIVLFMFTELLSKSSHREISQVFEQQFVESKAPNEERYKQLRTLILNKLRDIYSYRYRSKEMDLKQLLSADYAQRFLDDASDLYQKFMEKLPENTINEIHFLELNKTLTPCAVQKPQNSENAICKLIDFENSEQEDVADECNQVNEGIQKDSTQEKYQVTNSSNKDSFFKRSGTVEPLSPFRIFQHKGVTPLTTRHMNSNWLNSITSNPIKEEANEVRRIYEKYVGENYNSTYHRILGLITNSISQLTPDCPDFVKRQHLIYQLYSYCINRIAQTHTPLQMMEIFGQALNYFSIVCLSNDLFNYANVGFEGSYAKYCQIYEIGLLQGHRAVIWLAKNICLPKTIDSYIYNIQKKILIEQIWCSNEGYMLLNKEEKLKENDAVIKRLQKHVSERTQQLCYKMNIYDGEIIKTVNLVKFITQKRVILLKNHRIDQIIVCSIASILSINQSNLKYTLQQIFDHYNQLIYSFYSNKNDLYDSDGNRMGLVNFYNSIFLPLVEDIINGEQNSGILSTPVRLQRLKSKQLGVEMTPFSTKFKQAPKIISFSKVKFTQDQVLPANEHQGDNQGKKTFYRQSLRTNINKRMKDLVISDEAQSSSPTFRPLEFERGFSFGKFDHQ